MSSENRKKVLFGFGALVVILVAAILIWPSNFRKEDASGAIGEVQKHRAPQIAKSDVVLGNESVKHQQKVLYADFLADGAKLKALGARPDAAQLSAFALELGTRYRNEATEALAAEEMAARGNPAQAKMEAEITELQAFVRSHETLSDTDMQQLNLKLAHLGEAMNVRMSHTLDQSGEELAAAVKQLASARMENEFLAVAKQLQDVESQLSSRGLFAISLADEIQYLNETEMSARIVSARLGDQEMAHRLGQRGEELMARGVRNIEQEFQLESEMATRFRDMDDQIARASRIVGAEAGMASREKLAKTLGATSQALSARESEFRARETADRAEELAAVRALDASVASKVELLKRLEARQTP
ncbi:MAG: hypothetical protein M3041_01385 [Acidobacteriota bacterium]|nr:hypothetical protein [Acidobacteriota bacterium]